MTLLVSEIHPVNLCIFWFLSFFLRVEAYRINPMCPGLLARRIRAVDISQHLSWNNTHCFRSSVVQLWEELLAKFPTKGWSLRYRGKTLDFSTKAKQELLSYFDQLMLLRMIQQQPSQSSKVYIVDSPQFRYLKRVDPSAKFYEYPVFPVFSTISVVLDLLFMYVSVTQRMLALIGAMVYGSLVRDGQTQLRRRTIPYIWDSINSNELSVDPRRRFFPWIVDGHQVPIQDVLFIVPRGADKNARPDLHGAGYQAHTLLELYRIVPVRALLGCIAAMVTMMAKHMLPWSGGTVSIQKAAYFVRMMRLVPITQSFRPSCYVTNMSTMGNEEPATVLFNSLGLQTIMHSYSANAYLFGDESCSCDYRVQTFAHVLASHLLVWHQDFRDFIWQHPQDNTVVEVIGPLMSGDEGVMELPPTQLRSGLGIKSANGRDGLSYISFFDVAPAVDALKIARNRYPEPSTEEYNVAFLEDMMRLLEDYDDVALIYKPQRSLVGPKFSYSEEFRGLLDRLESNDRGFILDNAVNPWAPIAIADLCISMPFTPPALAAMHYGIPGLFHDPTGMAIRHRYRPISHFITHDYDELRSKVGTFLSNGSRYNRDKEIIWSEARSFIGDRPGINSSERFRNMLWKFHNQEDRT